MPLARWHDATPAQRLRAAAASVLAAAERSPGLRDRLARWVRRATYRPERHYMRGGRGTAAQRG
ncbi:hypothetical protein [Caldovatus aquaticus]|uniref:Uncharacterized protein n=1 Tax=Caldovatus aquaticus TaxID=2865671 RepID=A0ABS7F1R6_9PROT|nr:hypothetical protein [Caldovatus aquaticus]MBW8269434.1 hypothetical protein [Caldovatus aquaticus]